MSSSMKKAIKCAVVMIAAGVITVFCALILVKFDLSKLNTHKFEKKTYVVSEDFESINIKSVTSVLCFAPSEDDKCRVIADEREKVSYTVEVVNGVLNIGVENNEEWYDKLVFFSFGEEEKVTIYLPKNDYEKLYVKLTYGEIRIRDDFNFKAVDINTTSGEISLSGIKKTENINIKATSGDIDLKDIQTDELRVESRSGEIKLSDVTAEKDMSVKAASGDVDFNRCDSDNIYIKTTSGDVECSLLSEKLFSVNTKSGDVDVPVSTLTAGKCNIRTSSGDIEVKIKK